MNKDKDTNQDKTGQYGQLPDGGHAARLAKMKERALPPLPTETEPKTEPKTQDHQYGVLPKAKHLTPKAQLKTEAKPKRALPTPPKKNITPTQYQPVPTNMVEAAKLTKGKGTGPSMT